MKRTLNLDNLDEFVQEVDKKGGPTDLHALYTDLDLGCRFVDNGELDPFSEDYVDLQLEIYAAISGRQIDEYTTELHEFDFEHHVRAANPYGIRDVSHMARHTATLSNAFVLSKLPPAPNVLDMGCGWGLSTELLCFLGAKVTAIDINPLFLNLVEERSKRLAYSVNTIHSSFDDFAIEGAFDMILFYECLHHAVRPWTILKGLRRNLAQNGKIVLAGEPVQDIWWRYWGLRLDPLSVYCIRKYGWFESGWSREMLSRAFEAAGMQVSFEVGSALGAEPICVATAAEQHASPINGLKDIVPEDGWAVEAATWVSMGLSSILLPKRMQSANLQLEIWNFRGKGLSVEVEGVLAKHVELAPGVNFVSCRAFERIRFSGETWQPLLELGSTDYRMISFHLKAVEIEGFS